MRFECHNCKKEIDDVGSITYMMDKGGFTYCFCPKCAVQLKKSGRCGEKQ